MVANELVTKILDWANTLLPEETTVLANSPQPLHKPRQLLLVASQFIGDNVLLTPFIRNLRQSLGSNARIDLVSPPAIASLFETNPHLNRVFREKQGALKSPAQFLQARQYDTILFCRYSLIWGQAALQANVPQRVGFDLERLGIHRLQRWGRCLTHTIPSTSIYDSAHQTRLYQDMLEQMHLPVYQAPLECPLLEADLARAEQLLSRFSTPGPRILIHAAAGSPGKRWPMRRWHHLLDVLHAEYPTARFFAVGARTERPVYLDLAARFPLVNLCGQTSLRQSIALLARMDLVITLDTSIAHLAALAGTPRLVVLYGPTNQHQWKPLVKPGTVLQQVYRDLPCRPCIARTCATRECIRQLEVSQVMQAVRTCLPIWPMVNPPRLLQDRR